MVKKAETEGLRRKSAKIAGNRNFQRLKKHIFCDSLFQTKTKAKKFLRSFAKKPEPAKGLRRLTMATNAPSDLGLVRLCHNNVVHDAVIARLLGGEKIIAVRILLHLLDTLAAVLGDFPVQHIAPAQNFLCGDRDV